MVLHEDCCHGKLMEFSLKVWEQLPLDWCLFWQKSLCVGLCSEIVQFLTRLSYFSRNVRTCENLSWNVSLLEATSILWGGGGFLGPFFELWRTRFFHSQARPLSPGILHQNSKWHSSTVGKIISHFQRYRTLTVLLVVNVRCCSG